MFWKKKSGKAKSSAIGNIDILVLGNKGAGKTSLLAAMLYKKDKLEKYGIKFMPEDEETDKRLKQSISEMENMVTSEGDVKVGQGISGTDDFVDYNFSLEFTDQSNCCFNIIFHDYEGGILTKGEGKEYDKLKDVFLKSQVVFILIDTPYLMESTRKGFREQSAKDEILTLLQRLGGDYGKKLIAIVPAKCEYYLHNDRAFDVINQVRIEFDEILKCIDNLNNGDDEEKYKLYITPVQTTGGIEFSKMENEKPLWRRTKPGSKFEPQNTDVLLLFCMNYLFDLFFRSSIERITLKNRKSVMEKLKSIDNTNKTKDYYEQYNKLIAQKKEKNKSKNEIEKESENILKEALYAFFEKYDEETKIEKVCDIDQNVKKCHMIYCGKKEIIKNCGTSFKQHFTKI